METSSRLDEKSPADRRGSTREVEVATFFAALRTAQSSFLEAIGRAQADLDRESGQLSHVAAIQGRLTRQFFDAQRSIMMRRAEVDAEVALIGAAAEGQANQLVSAARARAAASGVYERSEGRAPGRLKPRAVVVVADLGAELEPRSARQEIAALGAAVVRTMAEADLLARVIDEAFEPDDPDGVASERQLSTLLDEWWRAENQEGRAVIDDANARAAMRHHVAGIEASEIIDELVEMAVAAQVADAIERATVVNDAPNIDLFNVVECDVADATTDRALIQLPMQMLTLLETADPARLQSLFAALAESLDVQSAKSVTQDAAAGSTPTMRPVDDLIIRADRVNAVVCPAKNAPDEVFRTFWKQGPAAVPDTAGWRWIPVRVALPTVAVALVLTLLMAWIG